jgi:hypothetical protein
MTHQALTHLIATTIIKGVIYSTIWRTMCGSTLADDVAVAGVIIAIWFLWCLRVDVPQVEVLAHYG